MCGIAGIYNTNGESVSRDHILGMTDILLHRGPDADGLYFENGLGLGHRRLAILDLTHAGEQPMSNSDKTIWIVFNGEIYNYRELKRELTALGRSFSTNTDTEVIIAAYETWGDACLQKFNGMWAFALWDTIKKRLFCARDRFGIKPFYYFFDGKTFAFASEIKALLTLPFIKKEPYEPMVYDYLALGLADHSHETFFTNIFQLEPSHSLTIENGRADIKKYYELAYTDRYFAFNETDAKKYSEEIIELLRDSVRLRLQSDVQVGSCLSGGLDSSTIVFLINSLLNTNGFSAKMIGERQKTFTSAFSDKRFDERKFVKEVIQATGAEDGYVFPSSECFKEELEQLVYHQEEPFAGTSAYAQWCVMRRAKEGGVTVLLDGQGADELFGGYPRYIDSYFNELLFHGKFLTLAREFAKASAVSTQTIPSLLFQPIKELALALPQNLRIMLRKRMDPVLSLVLPPLAKRYINRETQRAKKRDKANLQRRLWQDIVNFNLRSLLRNEDRNSMAFSIETRLPFLDYRLVERVFKIPSSYKIHNGWSKYLLRLAVKNMVPESIRWRRDKMGFVTPEKIWLAHHYAFFEKLFSKTTCLSAQYINSMKAHEMITRLKGDHKTGTSSLWRIINLELWLKKFF
ncbi:MAG: Asparagine synthetase [Parcubacteria group bacterium GW2011_GWC2_44_17]|uniref:asparagine synthase (glutamine-hydrolyzing) n=1 Tax=Candidatus Jacksonbacteria bacterium RIFCSPLOWO2_02_FULL_44_20 TaxID=1798460 RepID=A0A1G2A7Y9_9BACT|nr:MAG: Asparagine synthetase [Parcubacteria group bacterium GW2011_GWC2_44_17]OGY69495.1 MAG: asparagine synthase (glutamine-hydrolyzing) [Candidatus Jacksonbacteria bacterium RIFCSPHIGHO2_02_FULL_44_25]OGY71528.1 MAG: asparagine synthase (glutamine-hydrolyzing) [Candidatus Jacksonbacteria bacterium RIFCSPHIGHO2_12_FULL_44_12]OGY72779.1 MAG: asparagine synthase (glutamine-hydrolyzing) [Candidatus Jacksonbacteria bacterium RIFCSPLOWO2_02_FULL_44_20]HCA67039.1 asparagine synthase (glutamine-hydr